jgi:hypothetical protein
MSVGCVVSDECTSRPRDNLRPYYRCGIWCYREIDVVHREGYLVQLKVQLHQDFVENLIEICLLDRFPYYKVNFRFLIHRTDTCSIPPRGLSRLNLLYKSYDFPNETYISETRE